MTDTDATPEAGRDGVPRPPVGAPGEPAPVRTLANDHPVLRRHWHPVALVEEVTDAPVRVLVCGDALVVVRLADGIAVLPDACPHRSAPLSAGRVVDGHLECPYCKVIF